MAIPSEQCTRVKCIEVFIKTELAEDDDPLDRPHDSWNNGETRDGDTSLKEQHNKQSQDSTEQLARTSPTANIKEEYIEVEVAYPLECYTSTADTQNPPNADHSRTSNDERRALRTPDHSNCDKNSLSSFITSKISEIPSKTSDITSKTSAVTAKTSDLPSKTSDSDITAKSVGSITLISDARVKEFCNRRNRIRHPVSRDRRLYACDECGKSFVRNAHLVIHKRFHSGSKPFSCTECGLAVATVSILNEHRRIHTGEKPYACDECDVAFSKVSNLKRHKRIHAGEKPYLCDVCDTPFGRKSHLEKHRRTHS